MDMASFNSRIACSSAASGVRDGLDRSGQATRVAALCLYDEQAAWNSTFLRENTARSSIGGLARDPPTREVMILGMTCELRAYSA
jgi:hypothetical protein